MNFRAAAFLATGALLLGVLFVWLRPEPAPPAAPGQSLTAAAPAGPEPLSPSPPPAPAAPRTFELQIARGALVSGPAVLQVAQGDSVVLRVTADANDELHLHGYDLPLKLQAGVPGVLSFTADRTGRFEYELHHAHAALGALEVRPR